MTNAFDDVLSTNELSVLFAIGYKRAMTVIDKRLSDQILLLLLTNFHDSRWVRVVLGWVNSTTATHCILVATYNLTNLVLFFSDAAPSSFRRIIFHLHV
ncbi:hypothetical protein PsorP6_000249 [Peronosclerospora sorghi]|uniref:Uncharacterized protein n=1 Tax=Peronosclerospora sorghi TaxID=230839 RepID=A0ACC0WSW3_9STRA|nr:hypothetical protein PsorP6_000249 [Peronosclerospora sorghi]